MRVSVRRMVTSREDHTKYEHFVQATNSDGLTMDFWMRHKPAEALYHATELARFLGVQVEPLIIDGVEVELDDVMKRMLE